MTVVVVSQPMFLPWVGLFEQIRLADVFVHYDDVQLPQGRSFMSRVQVKGPQGTFWLTAPVDRRRSGRRICDCYYVGDRGWRDEHLATLRRCYAQAPAFDEMYALAEAIYAADTDNLSEFNIHSVETLARYLGLETTFAKSSELEIGGSSTERLVAICRHYGASRYVTGHGALQYLDHEAFERATIHVEYMDYRKTAYPQLHGAFTPFVTVLDAVAHCGAEARGLVQSGTVGWKDIVHGAKS